MKYIIPIFAIFLCSCKEKSNQNEGAVKDREAAQMATSKAAEASGKCFKICNPAKDPDLRFVVNGGSYYTERYGIAAYAPILTQNYTVTGYVARLYGWDSGVVINMIRVQCLVENIAPYDSTCKKDWEFDTSQGTLTGNVYLFENLFLFDTYEMGNGNNWKFLYTDSKKEFNPVNIPNMDYRYRNFCFYDRGIPCQNGDFYRNYFRLPPHDGRYKIVAKFNPVVKGCHAIKEVSYTGEDPYANDSKTIFVEINSGTVTITF